MEFLIEKMKRWPQMVAEQPSAIPESVPRKHSLVIRISLFTFQSLCNLQSPFPVPAMTRY